VSYQARSPTAPGRRTSPPFLLGASLSESARQLQDALRHLPLKLLVQVEGVWRIASIVFILLVVLGHKFSALFGAIKVELLTVARKLRVPPDMVRDALPIQHVQRGALGRRAEPDVRPADQRHAVRVSGQHGSAFAQRARAERELRQPHLRASEATRHARGAPPARNRAAHNPLAPLPGAARLGSESPRRRRSGYQKLKKIHLCMYLFIYVSTQFYS